MLEARAILTVNRVIRNLHNVHGDEGERDAWEQLVVSSLGVLRLRTMTARSIVWKETINHAYPVNTPNVTRTPWPI